MSVNSPEITASVAVTGASPRPIDVPAGARCA